MSRKHEALAESSGLSLSPPFDLTAFRTALLRWYRRNGRELPWRRPGDPYAVWISEIMLQQTTVTAVIPYFERFLTRFPTLVDLAAAEEEEVLRYWEGLGYYSRARNIHKAARKLVEEHAGEFPREVASLMRLPGIGRYTAGAIVSFAFDRPAPIVEANTLRLYARLLGYDGDPRSTAGQVLLWEFAEAVLPRKGAGKLNQALMDLGATVCTPREPTCGECPVRLFCRAAAEGRQQEIPRPVVRPEPTQVTEATLAVFRDDAVLLYRRNADERWAGLWDFPRFPAADSPGSVRRSLRESLEARFGVSARIGPLLTELRHTVTRFRITLQCYLAEHQATTHAAEGEQLRWVSLEELADYPLSVTGRKFARLLENREA